MFNKVLANLKKLHLILYYLKFQFENQKVYFHIICVSRDSNCRTCSNELTVAHSLFHIFEISINVDWFAENTSFFYPEFAKKIGRLVKKFYSIVKKIRSMMIETCIDLIF